MTPQAVVAPAADPGRRDRHRHRPLLGLRHTPGRLALAVFRMPLFFYRHGWGRLLGRTFLLLVHVGRKTGRPHEAVVMVLADDLGSAGEAGEVVICSGWGPGAEWLRNLHAGPAKELCIGRDRFAPEHRFLTEDEAVEVIASFRARHPHRARLITTILGWGDLRRDDELRTFVGTHPFVAFRPAANRDPREARR